MHINIFLLIFIGSLLLVNGLSVVFSNRYLKFMRQAPWLYSRNMIGNLFPGKFADIYDRYVVGTLSVLLGLLFVIFGFWSF